MCLSHLQVFEHFCQILQRCVLVTDELTDALVVFLQSGVRLIGLLEELQKNNHKNKHYYLILYPLQVQLYSLVFSIEHKQRDFESRLLFYMQLQLCGLGLSRVKHKNHHKL